MARLTYNPKVFDVPDETAAKRIILTPDGGLKTSERWETETPYLADLIGERIAAAPGGLVIDYGCGIGRLAKALIARNGWQVLGVDISQDMRALAPPYVASANFSVVSPEVFRTLVAGGLRAEGVFSVWVIQHCLDPQAELELIHSALGDTASLVVVNLKARAVPTVEKLWASDGVDVRQLLAARLAVREEGLLDPAVVGQHISDVSFWGVYDKR
ncbi:MAG: methyltransferase domain-containing protein [Phenylobacterium sp.]